MPIEWQMEMAAEERKQGTILLVEDDASVGDGFARVLRGAGYEVWLTTRAEEGLEKAKIVRPHAIIVDFRMPLVNGLGFLYRLRGEAGGSKTPVLVVTGDITLDDDVKAQLDELGAKLRFKPIMPDELIEAVGGMVGASAHPDAPQRTVW